MPDSPPPKVGDLITRRVAVAAPVERETLEATTKRAMAEVVRHAAEHGLVLGDPRVTVFIEVMAQAVGEEHADGNATIYDKPGVSQPEQPRFCVRCALPQTLWEEEPNCVPEGDHKLADAPRMMAYEGRDDCTSFQCRRFIGDDTRGCIGWHCAVCHEPSSQYGHPACMR